MIMHRFLAATLSALLALAPPPAPADVVDARLVKDIGTDPVGVSSAPGPFAEIGGLLYFSAYTPLSGRELYATDGVSAQPQLVANIAAGPASSFPKAVGQAGGRLLLEADDGEQGNALLALDRATGARSVLVHFNAPGGYASIVQPAAQLPGHLLFHAQGYLYTTDGSFAGTRRLVDISSTGTLGESICSLGSGALFVAPSADAYQALWHTDGSRASNRVVTGLAQDGRLVSVSGNGSQCYYLFVRGSGWTLWRSDGNSAVIAATRASGTPRDLAAAQSFAYVVDGDVGAPFRLWRSDVAEPLATSALQTFDDTDLRAAGDRLLFNGPYRDGSSNRSAVFISDGSAAGTRRIAPAAGLEMLLGRLVVSGDSVVLASGNGNWRIDMGTGSVTRTGDGVGVGGVINGRFIGRRWTFETGEEVYRSDASLAAPLLLHDIYQANANGVAPNFGLPGVGIGNTLYFTDVTDQLQSPTPRHSLWRSDGSAAGTQPMPRALYDEGGVEDLARFGERLVFRSWPQNASARYFLTDAAFSTSSLLVAESPYAALQSFGPQGAGGVLMGCRVGGDSGANLCATRAGESQATLVAAGVLNRVRIGATAGAGLFFQGDHLSGQRGLWRSDGTTPGTLLVQADLYPGYGSGDTRPSIAWQGGLLFNACSHPSGQCGLYASDGTQAGTRLIVALPLPVQEFAAVNGRVVMLLGSSESNNQLWVSDATAAGTLLLRPFSNRRLSNLASFGDRLHFIVEPLGSINGPAQYYVSDGTDAGTGALVLPAGLVPFGSSVALLDTETAVFSCSSARTGAEPCVISRQGGNARLVRDIRPGPDGSSARLIGATDNALYYAADDGYHGAELWQIKAWPDLLFDDGFQ
jgi:ELWxxDGT repeat protein